MAIMSIEEDNNEEGRTQFTVPVNDYIKYSDIWFWCCDQFGQPAMLFINVCEHKPWSMVIKETVVIVNFFNSNDASLFKLRWL
jgi:hypothetical protein